MTPDKRVRKAIYNAINNMVVNSVSIPCYDVRATNYRGKFYTIMSTQNKQQDNHKCGPGWTYSILLDFVARHGKNTGSRVQADDMEEAAMVIIDAGLTLDDGFVISNVTRESEPDITTVTNSEVIHRKLLRYTFSIN